MTTMDKIARRKLSLLDLASELSNVSRACKISGYSRQQFYEIRRNFQTYGAEGLLDRMPGARGPHPNRVAAEIEAAILDHALEHPCHGATRVEQELRLKGVQVSSGGVRGVWQRHNLLTKHQRLLRLEKATGERKIELKEDQIRLLERFSPEFRERHIEAPPYWRFGGGRYLLRRSFEGGWQGLPANGHRLPFPLRLGQALPLEAAAHRRSHHKPRRHPNLRGA